MTVDTAALRETAEWAGDLDGVHEQRIRSAADELDELRKSLEACMGIRLELAIVADRERAAHAETKRELEEMRSRLSTMTELRDRTEERLESAEAALRESYGVAPAAVAHFARFGGGT